MNHRGFLLAVAVALTALPGLVLAQRVVDHAFSFDANRESYDIEVLDYRYGTSKLPGTRPDEGFAKEGKVAQRANTIGPMVRGDFLFVKWRLRETGEILEDTVDLRNRLPSNIRDHRIHFIVRGRQLYVYLISPEKRPENELPGPLRMYLDLKVVTLYPDTRTK